MNIAAPYNTEPETENGVRERNQCWPRINFLLQDFFDWKVYQKNELVSIKTSKKDAEAYISWDNSHGM